MLVVDVGNSRLKFALAECGARVRLGPQTVVEIDKRDPATTARLLREAFSRLAEPTRVCVGSVSSSAVDSLIHQICNVLWRLNPIFLESPERGWGVTNAYRNPGSMGIDRFAAMVGAHHLYEGTKVVVDCGSAVTADVIDAQGRHLGGIIVPGTHMMRRALFADTARIPSMEDSDSQALGQSTAQAVVSGTIQAVVGALRAVFDEAETRLGERPVVVVTGGGADEVLPRLGECERPAFNLVLYGLAIMGGTAE